MTNLTLREVKELAGVHPLLILTLDAAVPIFRTMAAQTFTVTSGQRTKLEQQLLYDAGITPALDSSRHLNGMAVDLAILARDRKTAVWDVRRYRLLNQAIQTAARDTLLPGFSITWGGSWKSRDATHFQLDAKLSSLL